MMIGPNKQHTKKAIINKGEACVPGNASPFKDSIRTHSDYIPSIITQSDLFQYDAIYY